jgi:hypothetical protein
MGRAASNTLELHTLPVSLAIHVSACIGFIDRRNCACENPTSLGKIEDWDD